MASWAGPFLAGRVVSCSGLGNQEEQGMKFEIYREGGRSLLAQAVGDWRWRLRADNGRIIATSGEGYQNKADCLHGIELVTSASVATTVYDATQSRNLTRSVLGTWT